MITDEYLFKLSEVQQNGLDDIKKFSGERKRKKTSTNERHRHAQIFCHLRQKLEQQIVVFAQGFYMDKPGKYVHLNYKLQLELYLSFSFFRFLAARFRHICF